MKTKYLVLSKGTYKLSKPIKVTNDDFFEIEDGSLVKEDCN